MADVDGRGDGTELQPVARALADTVPQLVERLSRARPGRLYRQALELLERPLLGHVLEMNVFVLSSAFFSGSLSA